MYISDLGFERGKLDSVALRRVVTMRTTGNAPSPLVHKGYCSCITRPPLAAIAVAERRAFRSCRRVTECMLISQANGFEVESAANGAFFVGEG